MRGCLGTSHLPKSSAASIAHLSDLVKVEWKTLAVQQAGLGKHEQIVEDAVLLACSKLASSVTFGNCAQVIDKTCKGEAFAGCSCRILVSHASCMWTKHPTHSPFSAGSIASS